MNGPSEYPVSDSLCPKRVWVASFFADDEATQGDGELPQGLRFHLSRCAPCRRLADKLSSVTSSLSGLAHETAAPSLMVLAQDRAVEALRAGGQLSGRTELPDVIELPDYASMEWDWQRFSRVAAAAVIVISASLYGIVEWRTGASDPLPIDDTVVARPLDRAAVAEPSEENDAPNGSTVGAGTADQLASHGTTARVLELQRPPESMFSDEAGDPSDRELGPHFFPPFATDRTRAIGNPKFDRTETIGFTTENSRR